MDNSVVVSLRDIVVEFDGQRILDGLNLDIHDKEFVTLLGSSGCGKTTTLRLIAGFLEPNAGKVLLKGEDITGVPPYKRPVNTVFQKYALFPHLNVFENVAFGLRLKKLDEDTIRRKVRDMLEVVGLKGFGFAPWIAPADYRLQRCFPYATADSVWNPPFAPAKVSPAYSLTRLMVR